MKTIVHSGVLCLVLAMGRPVQADDPAIFSGPQVGERVTGLEMVGVYGDTAGKTFDPVAEADDKPFLFVFVHESTRPSAALTRALLNYAAMRKDDGLYAALIWLTADVSQSERYLKAATNWWGVGVPVGISPDGAEGPGSYGLNRNSSLTVLVGNKGRVTANFALVQPSMTDAPKVFTEVVKLIGGEVPTAREFDFLRFGADLDIEFREVFLEVIRAGDDPEALSQAAKAVDAYVGDDPDRQKELGATAAGLYVKKDEKGKAKYGPETNPAQQELFGAWADKYADKSEKEDGQMERRKKRKSKS